MYRGAYDEGCTDSIDSRSCGVVGWGAVALRAGDDGALSHGFMLSTTRD